MSLNPFNTSEQNDKNEIINFLVINEKVYQNKYIKPNDNIQYLLDEKDNLIFRDLVNKICNNQYAYVEQYLKNNIKYLNCIDDTGNPLIYYATHMCVRPKIVKLLIELGANPNPLILISSKRPLHLIEFLKSSFNYIGI